MICTNCSQQCPPAAVFCTHCGSKLSLSSPQSAIRCLRCKQDSPQGALFCEHCGESLHRYRPVPQRPCPACGELQPQDATHCARCGEPIPDGPLHAYTQCSRCGALCAEQAEYCIHCGEALGAVHAHAPRCLICRQVVAPSARYCDHCGSLLPHAQPLTLTLCPRCGEESPALSLYCMRCGEALPTIPPQENSLRQSPRLVAAERMPAAVAAVRCPSCGHAPLPGATYCTRCGHVLKRYRSLRGLYKESTAQMESPDRQSSPQANAALQVEQPSAQREALAQPRSDDAPSVERPGSPSAPATSDAALTGDAPRNLAAEFFASRKRACDDTHALAADAAKEHPHTAAAVISPLSLGVPDLSLHATLGGGSSHLQETCAVFPLETADQTEAHLQQNAAPIRPKADAATPKQAAEKASMASAAKEDRNGKAQMTQASQDIGDAQQALLELQRTLQPSQAVDQALDCLSGALDGRQDPQAIARALQSISHALAQRMDGLPKPAVAEDGAPDALYCPICGEALPANVPQCLFCGHDLNTRKTPARSAKKGHGHSLEQPQDAPANAAPQQCGEDRDLTQRPFDALKDAQIHTGDLSLEQTATCPGENAPAPPETASVALPVLRSQPCRALTGRILGAALCVVLFASGLLWWGGALDSPRPVTGQVAPGAVHSAAPTDAPVASPSVDSALSPDDAPLSMQQNLQGPGEQGQPLRADQVDPAGWEIPLGQGLPVDPAATGDQVSASGLAPQV